MSDKFVGGIVTAVAIAPICAVCVLGPAFVGSVVGGWLAWLGDLGLFATVAIVVAVATLLFATRNRTKTRKRKSPGRIDQHEPAARGRGERELDRPGSPAGDPAATGFGA